jgi:hypothetical protein
MSTRDIIRLVERIKARNVFVQCGDAGSGGTGEPPITPGTVSQYWRGDKTWQPLTKNAVGLANVDNTADFDKPVSTATAGAINVVAVALDGKAATTHGHAVGDVSGLSSTLAGKLDTSHAGAGGAVHAAVVAAGAAGFMTGADKTKLDSIAAGATANSTDASLRDRTTHTGSQAIATVTGLQTALDGKQAAGSYLTPGGALGTPASGTLSSCTGLPVGTGVSGLGTGVAAFLASPTSANMAAMLTDETGTGSNVFGTAPTLTNPILASTTYMQQGAQTSKAAAATLTIAELLTGIIQYTGAAASLTLPTGTLIDAGVLAGLPVDRAFEFIVINTGTGAATLVAGTGLTLVGSMAVAIATSARFRVRKTAANTFTVYRV